MEHDKLDGRDAPAEEHEAGANKPITRKKFIAGAGAAGAGIALAGLPGVASARGWACAATGSPRRFAPRRLTSACSVFINAPRGRCPPA